MDNPLLKHIPNTFTCCNLLSGALATYSAFNYAPTWAFTFIIIGAVFDFFDGFAARLFHVSSPIGKELDSLADNITFGLAPSAMVFTLLEKMSGSGLMHVLAFAAFIIAAFSALRLAKFNLDERQAHTFIGLPTPANALFWGAFCISMEEQMTELGNGRWLILGMVAVCCWLLVAEIPMFALKFKSFSWKQNKVRYIFLLTSILIIAIPLVTCQSIAGVWMAIVWYILLSLLTGRRTKQST